MPEAVRDQKKVFVDGGSVVLNSDSFLAIDCKEAGPNPIHLAFTAFSSS